MHAAEFLEFEKRKQQRETIAYPEAKMPSLEIL